MGRGVLLVLILKEQVVGQDEFLQDLCTSVWFHMMRKNLHEETGAVYLNPKWNMLVLGKSGTGKTSTIKALADLLDLSVVIEDASQFTGAGWKGREVTSIIKNVITATDDPVKADYTIVVLDEIDKIIVSNSERNTFCAMNNFLKMMEGAELQYDENGKSYRMKTSYLLFICLGAFDGLEEIIKKRLHQGISIGFNTSQKDDEITENLFRHVEKQDLLDYEINAQFLGRISTITATNELTADAFKRELFCIGEKKHLAEICLDYDTEKEQLVLKYREDYVYRKKKKRRLNTMEAQEK